MIDEKTITEITNIVHDYWGEAFEKGIDEKLKYWVDDMFFDWLTEQERENKKEGALKVIEKLKTIINQF